MAELRGAQVEYDACYEMMAATVRMRALRAAVWEGLQDGADCLCGSGEAYSGCSKGD